MPHETSTIKTMTAHNQKSASNSKRTDNMILTGRPLSSFMIYRTSRISAIQPDNFKSIFIKRDAMKRLKTVQTSPSLRSYVSHWRCAVKTLQAYTIRRTIAENNSTCQWPANDRSNEGCSSIFLENKNKILELFFCLVVSRVG